MPLFLALAGILLIVAGVKGKEQDLLTQATSDGKAFFVWIVLILVVGAIGFSKALRPISNAFFVLIFIAFILASGNQLIAGAKQLTSGATK